MEKYVFEMIVRPNPVTKFSYADELQADKERFHMLASLGSFASVDLLFENNGSFTVLDILEYDQPSCSDWCVQILYRRSTGSCLPF
jgi:hypothetical protein